MRKAGVRLVYVETVIPCLELLTSQLEAGHLSQTLGCVGQARARMQQGVLGAAKLSSGSSKQAH